MKPTEDEAEKDEAGNKETMALDISKEESRG